jgi:hypothetical protein
VHDRAAYRVTYWELSGDDATDRWTHESPTMLADPLVAGRFAVLTSDDGPTVIYDATVQLAELPLDRFARGVAPLGDGVALALADQPAMIWWRRGELAELPHDVAAEAITAVRGGVATYEQDVLCVWRSDRQGPITAPVPCEYPIGTPLVIAGRSLTIAAAGRRLIRGVWSDGQITAIAAGAPWRTPISVDQASAIIDRCIEPTRPAMDVDPDEPLIDVLPPELRERIADRSPVYLAEVAQQLGMSVRAVVAAIKARRRRLVPPCPVAGYDYLGTFTTSGSVTIADPCYLGARTRNPLLPLTVQLIVAPGTWHVFARNAAPPDSSATAELAVIHDTGFDADAIEFVGDIGVDTGRVGVFDSACRTLDLRERELAEGVVDDLGAVTSSGKGDGFYPAFVGRQHGQVVKIRVSYLATAPERDDSFAPTAARCAAIWCDELPRATLSTVAATLGDDFPVALALAGAHAEALAWALAPSDDGDRSIAMARLGAARRAPDLIAAAWDLAPWQERVFAQLVVIAGLDDPGIRAISRAKLSDAGEPGVVAAAWYVALDPCSEPAERLPLPRLADRDGGLRDDGTLAFCAGLWRAGDASMRDEVHERFTRSYYHWALPLAIAAAPSVEELLALPVEDSNPREPAQVALCTRLVQLGAIDEARACSSSRPALEALVAGLTGDRAALDALERRWPEDSEAHAEGLISAADWRDFVIAIASGLARTGDPGRGRALLADLAEQECADLLAKGRDEALRALTGQPPAPAPRSIDRALAEWRDVDVRATGTFRPRRTAKRVLGAACIHARRGERERARELVAIVTARFSERDDPSPPPWIIDDLIEAYAELGELDAIHSLEHGPLSMAAAAAYSRALVAAGEPDAAIIELHSAVRRARTRGDLLALIPALRAVAPGCESALRDAWQRADDAVTTLRVTAS